MLKVWSMDFNLNRRRFLLDLGGVGLMAFTSNIWNSSFATMDGLNNYQVKDVNYTDLPGAIKLGCQTMSNIFNADDGNIPFFRSSIGKITEFSFSPSHTESHVPGRSLNALLNAESVLPYKVSPGVVDRHAAAAFFSYSGSIPMPLNRDKIGGNLNRFLPHNIREGFHALYSLVKFRKSAKADKLAQASIEFILQNWNADNGWDKEKIERKFNVVLLQAPVGTFISGVARALGPLVKYYKATKYTKALELAIILKDKAIKEFFLPDGSFSIERMGTHTHSVTCVMSSLAQLAAMTSDANLLQRVKVFYDNGLKEISNEFGWSVESCSPDANPDRGEANNTGDILETALILGKWGYTEYYDHAERILRAHLLPSQLRDISFIKEPENPNNEDRKKDVARRHQGAFGFPAPYGHKPVGMENISFNMDIAGGVVGSLVEAYRAIYSYTETGHRVNLLFDFESDKIKFGSPYPDGRLKILVKKTAPVFVRIPSWVERSKIAVEPSNKFMFINDYLFISKPAVGEEMVIRFPLQERQVSLKYRDRKIAARMLGDSVLAMQNFGADWTFFDDLN